MTVTTTPQPDKPAADAVSVAAQEVNVTGENVHVEGQDETAKKKDREALAGLVAEAVDLEDRKKAEAIKNAAIAAKEERKEDADERRDIRAGDAKTAADVRGKEFKKTILVIILAAVPPTLIATGGLVVAWRDAAVNASTHMLVNSASLEQRKTNVRNARRIYLLTMDPEDKKELEEAEKAVEEHIAKQKLADAKAGK